jgi:membrane protease YdiL (CAAX protease family)
MRDVGAGLALALAVGIPGLAAYLAFLALGLNATVVPTAGDSHWWTIPVLLLVAVRAAVTEEVIAIGYLYARLAELGWSRWPIILSSALLRGSYHLYQGYGAFIANVVMGIAFGWLYTRFGRLLPLVVTHFAIDAAVFIGYPWAASAFPALFGL